MLEKQKSNFLKRIIKYKYVLLFFVVFTLLFGASHSALALKTELNYPNIGVLGGFGLGENPTIGQLISYLFYLAVAAAGVLGVLSITISGIRLLAAAGNPSAMGEARERIFGSILGIVLLMFSFILLQTINPQLVNLQSLDLQQQDGLYYIKLSSSLNENTHKTAFENINIFGINTASADSINNYEFLAAPDNADKEAIASIKQQGFTYLYYKCDPSKPDASDLVIYETPTDNINNPEEDFDNIDADSILIPCTNTFDDAILSLDNIQHYETDELSSAAGVYLFTGQNCWDSNSDGDASLDDNGIASRIITTSGQIPAYFQNNVHSLWIENGTGDDDSYIGAVLAGADGSSNCSQPYVTTSSDGKCFNVETNPSCPVPPPTGNHLACVNQTCSIVTGSGTDSCTTSPDSCVSNPTTHLACVSQTCTQVSGSGSDSCTTSPDSCTSNPPGTSLTVIKNVVGGTKNISDFDPYIDAVLTSWGIENPVSPGNHRASEFSNDTNYTLSVSGDCDPNTGEVFVGANEQKFCIFTNTYNSSSPSNFDLTVNKTGNGTGTVTSSPSGINCGSTCSANYSSGTVVTLTPSAASGSTFTGWSGDCFGSGSCLVTMDAAKDVTANFTTATAQTFTLQVNKTGAGAQNGTVISNPTGINCGNTCSNTYPAGTALTLSASVVNGATFAGWGVASCPGTGNCNIVMNQDTIVNPVFNQPSVPNNYILTVSKAGNGMGTVTSSPAGINCGTTCSASYQEFTFVTLTASATSGSFAGWSGSGCSSTGQCNVTMNAAKNVTATFSVSGSGTKASLTLIKTLANSGPAFPTDWTLTAFPDNATSSAGGTPLSGPSNTNGLMVPGTYSLSETQVPNYTPTNAFPASWSCTNNINRSNTVTLANNENVTCTISNTYTGAPPPNAPTITITANPTSIPVGGSSTLTWSSTNANNCTASGSWSGNRATSGSLSVSPATTSTYTLTCTGSGGSASNSATVTITPALTVFFPNPSAGGSISPAPGIYYYPQGQWVTVSAFANPGYTFDSFQVDGVTQTGNPNPDVIAILMDTNHGVEAFFTANPTAPTVTITANPTSVPVGGSSTLTWSTSDANSCTASGGWSGAKATSGTQNVGPLNTTTTYTLTCIGSAGQASSSATVTVGGASQPPIITIGASPNNVASGGSSTLQWSSTNTTTCTASNGWTGNKPVNGSQNTGALNNTTTYTITCSGSGGSDTKSVTVTVGGNPPNPGPGPGASNPIHANLALFDSINQYIKPAISSNTTFSRIILTDNAPNSDPGSTCPASAEFIHILHFDNGKTANTRKPVTIYGYGGPGKDYPGQQLTSSKYLELSQQTIGERWKFEGDLSEYFDNNSISQVGQAQTIGPETNSYPHFNHVDGEDYTFIMYSGNKNNPDLDKMCTIINNSFEAINSKNSGAFLGDGRRIYETDIFKSQK